MTGPREAVVQAQIVAYLIRSGFVDVGDQRWSGTFPAGCRGVFYRNNTGAYAPRPGSFVRFGCRGSADLVGTLAPSGRSFAVEVKRAKGGKLSADQQRWGAALTQAGGRYIVATCVDDVRFALEER